ncbi:hypothetical protein SSZBM1_211 [Synechococcus phage S-SZBM1]|uniref:Uncharacterized protein n=1 Tax=Synechococcus phage S-SZBM1 TaxID=2926475 RepID=A0AC61TSX7_9CAUD|nr:hypothetical protein PP650_gp065 [Synechococcus phage S-SZBM1]UNH61328.1 hypothetical protein SSZBM1_211 [Synechococcus phage S-SZBM1]
MANNPIPDNVTDMMKNDFGTVVLITDPRSDKYLNKTKQNPPSDRLSRWCGGKYGFDDYVERM